MQDTTQGSQSVGKVRQAFREAMKPLTINDVIALKPDLKPNQVSTAFCYLMRQKYVIREQIDNPAAKGRKKIWIYTYSDDRYVQNPQTV